MYREASVPPNTFQRKEQDKHLVVRNFCPKCVEYKYLNDRPACDHITISIYIVCTVCMVRVDIRVICVYGYLILRYVFEYIFIWYDASIRSLLSPGVSVSFLQLLCYVISL